MFNFFSVEAGADDVCWLAAVAADGDGKGALLFPHAVMNKNKKDKTNIMIDLLDIFIVVFLLILYFIW
jgi:hypothetical protein